MSTREQFIKARLGMLALADALKNVTRARRRLPLSGRHPWRGVRATTHPPIFLLTYFIIIVR